MDAVFTLLHDYWWLVLIAGIALGGVAGFGFVFFVSSQAIATTVLSLTVGTTVGAALGGALAMGITMLGSQPAQASPLMRPPDTQVVVVRLSVDEDPRQPDHWRVGAVVEAGRRDDGFERSVVVAPGQSPEPGIIELLDAAVATYDAQRLRIDTETALPQGLRELALDLAAERGIRATGTW